MEKVVDCFHQVRFTGHDGCPTTSRVPVVQELTRRGAQKLSERFNRLPRNDVVPPSDSPPVIDMTKLTPDSDPDTRTKELGRLAAAAEDWGMFFVTGHGVPPALMASLKDVIQGFFDLSFEEKKKSVGSYFDTDNLGYGRSFVQSDDQTLDWIDRLAMRVYPNQDHHGLRIWPLNPENFRQVMEDYAERVRNACEQLLEAMAEAFGMERKSFTQVFEPKSECIVNVRVNYYPPLPDSFEQADEKALGISPHSDASAVTVLAQFDGTEGLEVLRPTGWVRVPAPEDALLIGAGDLIEVMSNGKVESPWHRAVARGEKERFSVALFYYPPQHAEVEPVEGAAAEEKYRKVVVGEYLRNYYKVSPTKEKTSINYAKV